ncbi:transposase, partial [Paenibacillus sp. GCM10023252]|uniref:transposase n=1 Tax=Paenibacillus sp. GCM10023252 TaxID=3252649 RepID=UPI00361BB189
MRKRPSVEKQIEIVKEAMSGVKVGVLARMYDVHPETVRKWVRAYRDDISPEDIPTPSEHLEELKRLQELEER